MPNFQTFRDYIHSYIVGKMEFRLLFHDPFGWVRFVCWMFVSCFRFVLAPWCAGMCDVYRYFRVKYVRVPTPCIRWSQAVFAEPWMREFQMKLNQCLQKPTTQHRHWSDRTKQRWKPLEAIGKPLEAELFQSSFVVTKDATHLIRFVNPPSTAWGQNIFFVRHPHCIEQLPIADWFVPPSSRNSKTPLKHGT